MQDANCRAELQVYRHLLFNRLGRADSRLDPSILRLGILLLLFDVYLTWARIEKTFTTSSAAGSSTSSSPLLSSAPMLLQYLFFLTMNTFATLAHHGTVRLLARIFLPNARPPSSPEPAPASASSGSGSPEKETPPAATTAYASNTMIHPSSISTALLVSSCTKLFPILLVIWDPSDPPSPSPESAGPTTSAAAAATSTSSFSLRARSYVGWAVLVNNVEALLILLDCGYVWAITLALAGMASRWAVEGLILGMVGLDGEAGPIGGMVWAVKYLMGMAGWLAPRGVGNWIPHVRICVLKP